MSSTFYIFCSFCMIGLEFQGEILHTHVVIIYAHAMWRIISDTQYSPRESVTRRIIVCQQFALTVSAHYWKGFQGHGVKGQGNRNIRWRRHTARRFAVQYHILVSALYALHEKAVRLSVCPSICLSNAWIVTKRKKVLPIWKSIYSSFLTRRMVGATPSTWNCGSNWPRWSEIFDFQSMFARSVSAVTPSGKVQ